MRGLHALLLALLLLPVAVATHAPAAWNQAWRYAGPGDAIHTGGSLAVMVGGQDFHAPAGATTALVRVFDDSGFPQSVVACEEIDGSCVRRVELPSTRGCATVEVPLVTASATLHVHVVSNAGAALRGFGCGADVPGPTIGTIRVAFG